MITLEASKNRMVIIIDYLKYILVVNSNKGLLIHVQLLSTKIYNCE